MFFKTFGKKPSGLHLDKITRSPHFKNGEFQNSEPTPLTIKTNSMVSILLKLFKNSSRRTPSQKIPTIKTDLNSIPRSSIPSIVWFGHSSYLISYNGFTILVDPVLFGTAAPFSWLVKPFKGSCIYEPNDIPHIDLLILTHDHYDHMSYTTLCKLKSKISNVICPLGVSSHLTYWGYDNTHITELDREESKTIHENIRITALSSRHFSGRFLKRNNTFWNSYCLNLGDYTVYIGGDSGYTNEFNTIGEKYGPFDLAFIECGQYNENWPFIHMTPEETARAAENLKTNILFPVHWGKFALALHGWNEPIQRLHAYREKTKGEYKIFTPQIGEIVPLDQGYKNIAWWDSLR